MSDSISPKQCKVCGQEKPATNEYFHRHKNYKDGLSTTCKECAKARSAKWYADNHERALERDRKKYRDNPEPARQRASQWAKDNPERYKARLQKWGDENREYRREQDRRYTEAHREEAKQRAKQWYLDNPEKVEQHRIIRYARSYNAAGKHTPADVQAIYEAQGFRCGYCGIPIFRDIRRDIHKDHATPLSRGGSNYPENIVLACSDCNMAKHDKTFEEWMQHRDW